MAALRSSPSTVVCSVVEGAYAPGPPCLPICAHLLNLASWSLKEGVQVRGKGGNARADSLADFLSHQEGVQTLKIQKSSCQGKDITTNI